jgi:hypothetical protein
MQRCQSDGIWSTHFPTQSISKVTFCSLQDSMTRIAQIFTSTTSNYSRLFNLRKIWFYIDQVESNEDLVKSNDQFKNEIR